MKPSIGRIVHYVVPLSRVHQAAIITAVYENGCTLTVFPEGSQPYTRTEVKESETPEPNTWHAPEMV